MISGGGERTRTAGQCSEIVSELVSCEHEKRGVIMSEAFCARVRRMFSAE
jgi:hypothetical protein